MQMQAAQPRPELPKQSLGRAEKSLRAALAKARNYDSPALSAESRATLDNLAQRVAQGLAVLSSQERRLALQ